MAHYKNVSFESSLVRSIDSTIGFANSFFGNIVMRNWNWILTACAALGIGSQSFAEPYAPQVGQRHPEFVLPTIGEGKPVSLSQFRGKKILLIQFASW